MRNYSRVRLRIIVHFLSIIGGILSIVVIPLTRPGETLSSFCYDEVGDDQFCFNNEGDCNKDQKSDQIPESHCDKEDSSMVPISLYLK
jgi:hypothetical protein